MKKVIYFLLFFVILLGISYLFKNQISEFIYSSFKDGIKVSTLEPNEYYRPVSYSYVQITDDFEAKNYQHLMNIYYTITNSGSEEFSFKCAYDECLSDVDELSSNQQVLSNINSFVHPYNSFTAVETKYNSIGKVIITVERNYTKSDIKAVNEALNYIYTNVIKNETDSRKIIKLAHDYIINKTKYDSDRSDLQIVNYKSSIAYGPLIEGYSLCGGYTDAMALILDHYNIPNFKVISENHVWNAVKLNNNWYHLDLTWDDPVASDGRNILDYKFFLITTKELEKKEVSQHIYDKKVFAEIA